MVKKKLTMKQVRLSPDYGNAITQEQVAKKLGVTKATISSWETGTRHPSAVKFLEWCRVMKADPRIVKMH